MASNCLSQDDIDWQSFGRNFFIRTGLDLAEYQHSPILSNVRSIACSRGENLGSLANRISVDDELCASVLHEVSVHTTQLFRDPERWVDFQEEIIPSFGSRSIRTWCAGCSNGSEAYSLASCFETAQIKGTILATDVDNSVLSKANAGWFAEREAQFVMPHIRRSHFDTARDGFLAKAALKARLQFEQHNLLELPPEREFDLISCRNVAIYLTDEARGNLYRRLWRVLKPGGFLFLGATERIFSPEEFGFQAVARCFYRKLAA
jgi:chemotaxis protein methyltransferase CheR